MEDFVVDVLAELERREPEVCGCEEEEDKGSCVLGELASASRESTTKGRDLV